MEIIAHRGFWKKASEKNTMSSFINASDFGVGTETDFRDYNGKLVVSHDIANASCPTADVFFALYKGSDKTLALNVKADGIQKLLSEAIKRNNISRYFCFDMSIPDTLGYIQEGLLFYVRQSEYEDINALYDKAEGVWVDGFESDTWITTELIAEHRRKGKKVCIVSSDLHDRDYKLLWERLRTDSILGDDNIILCTDHPDEAKEFFYG